MRIARFVTCLTDTLFPATGRAVVTLLERLGHQVEFPEGQTCCGQMHFNSGYRRESLPMARGFAEAFAGFDVIVSPSASCTAMVRDKVAAVQQAQAEVLCAADNSCLMHIGGSLSRQRAGVSTMHLAEILASTEDQPAVPQGHVTAGGR